MKRTSLAVLMIALALVALAAPLAYAQAPAPKVTINGFIDSVTAYSQNNANYNGGVFNRGDSQWYARSRGRFDIIGEVGKAKAVFGFEIDAVYGQTGSNDSTIVNAGAASATAVQAQPGTSGSFDLNTDTRAIFEVKWLYVEFPLPLIPVPTTVRIGAQPFGAAATYKVATYANGDFAGVNLVSQITPNVKLLGTYVQVEEALVGTDTASFPVTTTPTGVSSTQVRGDDFAYILSAEITPFKGLDIKPLFSMFYAQGTTSSSARAGRGGIGTGTGFFASAGSGSDCGAQAGGPGTNCFRGGINEYRYTAGIDARLRMGPFSLDPTVLYQFGNRAVIAPSSGVFVTQAGAVPDRRYYANIDAWLFDVRAGFQLGPLLLEALGVYSTGNSARNTTLGTVRYFQPLDTDTSYQADWGSQITALGLDYVNTWNSAAGRIPYTGNQIGWDKYGRIQVGAKATYAITPTLNIMGGANVHWSAEPMDRNGVATASAGITPQFVDPTPRDSSRYVGTELFSVINWQLSPGLVWSNSAGYMFMGGALDGVTDPTAGGRNTNDPWIVTSRVRFSF